MPILMLPNANRRRSKKDIFDKVFIFGCFNELSDQGKAVRELMRVTKPGKLIVIRERQTINKRLFSRIEHCSRGRSLRKARDEKNLANDHRKEVLF